jgi:transcriptional regulator with XRE-family HTH domain
MLIGNRLRELREQKNLSQGDIEERTGLLRCYVSRVENGHTVPAVETLEKFARALKVPLYQLFYDGDEPPKLPKLPRFKGVASVWGASGKDAGLLQQFRQLLRRTNESDRKLLLHMARKMAKKPAA